MATKGMHLTEGKPTFFSLPLRNSGLLTEITGRPLDAFQARVFYRRMLSAASSSPRPGVLEAELSSIELTEVRSGRTADGKEVTLLSGFLRLRPLSEGLPRKARVEFIFSVDKHLRFSDGVYFGGLLGNAIERMRAAEMTRLPIVYQDNSLLKTIYAEAVWALARKARGSGVRITAVFDRLTREALQALGAILEMEGQILFWQIEDAKMQVRNYLLRPMVAAQVAAVEGHSFARKLASCLSSKL